MSPRPLLRIVPAPGQYVPDVRFCGYCGATPEPASDARICGTCDLGVILSASGAVAPSAGQPSLVIDNTLRICAVSRAAEELLHVEEADAVRMPLAALLLPAHAEGVGLDGLISTVLSAVSADGDPQRAVVRPAGEWGVRYAVRIGACGPPRAALLVLDDAEV